MSIFKVFGASAAALALLGGLGGCSSAPAEQAINTDAVATSTSHTKGSASPVKIEQIIQSGDSFSLLKDGIYRMTIDKEAAGTKNDLPCIVFKDHESRSKASSMATE